MGWVLENENRRIVGCVGNSRFGRNSKDQNYKANDTEPAQALVDPTAGDSPCFGGDSTRSRFGSAFRTIRLIMIAATPFS